MRIRSRCMANCAHARACELMVGALGGIVEGERDVNMKRDPSLAIMSEFVLPTYALEEEEEDAAFGSRSQSNGSSSFDSSDA